MGARYIVRQDQSKLARDGVRLDSLRPVSAWGQMKNTLAMYKSWEISFTDAVISSPKHGGLHALSHALVLISEMYGDISKIKKGHGFETAFAVYSRGDVIQLCGFTNSNGQSFIAPAEGLFVTMPK